MCSRIQAFVMWKCIPFMPLSSPLPLDFGWFLWARPRKAFTRTHRHTNIYYWEEIGNGNGGGLYQNDMRALHWNQFHFHSHFTHHAHSEQSALNVGKLIMHLIYALNGNGCFSGSIWAFHESNAWHNSNACAKRISHLYTKPFFVRVLPW